MLKTQVNKMDTETNPKEMSTTRYITFCLMKKKKKLLFPYRYRLFFPIALSYSLPLATYYSTQPKYSVKNPTFLSAVLTEQGHRWLLFAYRYGLFFYVVSLPPSLKQHIKVFPQNIRLKYPPFPSA